MNETTVTRIERWRGRLRRLARAARRATPLVAGMLLAFAAVLLYNTLLPGPTRLTNRDVRDVVAQAMASATPPPAFSAQVYGAIAPSLVLIQTNSLSTAGKTEHGLGSGVVMDDQGDILTSLHVVDGAVDINITFADGTESRGRIVNSTPEQDIAVLRATNPPAQLVPATLGSAGSLRIGDEAYVVGNPFGLGGSMSAGIISGLGRTFKPPNGKAPLQNMIQFDAAANPGNSGGPLLDRYGEVVGIVTGIANPTGEDVFIGIGFAVPIETAASAAGSPPY